MRARALVAALLACLSWAGAAWAQPSPPAVSGGSDAWSAAVSVPVSATGGAGAVGHEYRTSSDGGASWSSEFSGSSVGITFDGETLVQFRSVDGIGGFSAWVPAHSPSPDADGRVRIDRYAPPIPAVPTGPALTRTAPALTWPVASDAGDSGIAGYQVVRGGSVIASTASTSYTDPAAPEGSVQYRVRAVDAAGNVSLDSPAVTVVHDATAPTAPDVSGGGSDPVSRDAVRFTASGATDALSGVAGYEYRTSGEEGVSWSEPLSGGVVDVTVEGRTLIQFRAVDAAGNAGPWAPDHSAGAVPEATAYIDRTAPDAGTAPGGARYPLVVRWEGVAGADLYAVLRDDAEVARAAATSLTDVDAPDLEAPATPGLPSALVPARGRVILTWPAAADAGTDYRYAIRPLDLAGNAGADSDTVTLTARSGTAEYEVRIDGRVAARTSGTSATFRGLDPNRTYSFSVVAVDGAGNASEQSGSLGVRPIPGAIPRIALETERDAVRPGVEMWLRATVRGPASGPVAWDLGDGTRAEGSSVRHRYDGEGVRVVSATVNSPTGRPVRVTRRIVVDGTPPVLRIGLDGERLRATARDRLSGVAWTALMGDPVRDVPAEGLVLPDGRHALRVRAADRAGNAVEIRRTVLVDGTIPRLRVTAPVAVAAPTAEAVVSVGDATSGLEGMTVDGEAIPVDRRVVTLTTGRPHLVVATDRKGNRSRVRVLIRRVPTAPARHRSLDGARRDQVRFSFAERPVRGPRRAVLMEVQVRLMATGHLPARWRPAPRFTTRLLRVVQTYQRQAGLPPLGTIGPSTRRALARDTARPVSHAAG